MQVSYDAEADAAYIKLSTKKPNGAIEIDEGIIIHATKENKIAGIEILDASQKLSVRQLFRFEVG